MSHSSTSGDRPSIPSPRPQPGKVAHHPTGSSSRPGTAGITNPEASNVYASVPPVGPRNPQRPQYDYTQTTTGTPTQPQSRGFGVHSILNPSSEPIQQSPVATPQLPAAAAGQTSLPPPTASPRSRKRAEPSSPTRTQHGAPSASSGRRVLTPKSPATRVASIGGRGTSAYHATGPSLQTLIGPEPRIYMAEPGTADIPSLPPISNTARSALPGIPGPDTWQNQGRPQHFGPSIATTQTASPSTSHTSQSQPDQASPAFRYGQMPATQAGQATFRQQQIGIPMGYSGEQGPRGPLESYQVGQPAYQMTLETDQGPMVVPVELDLQQASKTADEKRKRNAGASARFRQRRKEKEKEASHTIASLQQDLRELREERDFYRNERNFIREFATRQVGLQLPPRPPSPHFHRMTAPPVSTYEGSRSTDDIGRARSDSAPAPQRRRTGDYQPQYSVATQQSPIPQAFGTGYAPNPPLPLPPPQIRGQAPGQPYASPRSLPPAPSGPAATGPRSQSSYDPFRRDPFDRNWNPGR